MRRAWLLTKNDWAEMMRSKTVPATLAAMPLIFLLIGLGTLYPFSLPGALESETTNQTDGQSLATMAGPVCSGLDEATCVMAYMASLFMLLFIMLPAILPSVLAAHSIVSEKQAGTLEPLLASPIRVWEIVAGKALASWLPSIVVSGIAGGIYLAGVAALLPDDAVRPLLAPHWFIALGLVGPLLALAAVLLAMAVSTRAPDVRTAQQLSGTLVLPVAGLLVAQSFGKAQMTPALVAAITVALVAIDAVLLFVVTRLFDREAILARR